MAPTVLIGLFVAAPIALSLLLRSNAAVAFLALCTGSVMVKYISDSAVLAVSTVSSSNSDAIANIALILLPVVLSLLILRHTISPSNMLAIILPAIFLGFATPLLVVPFLPGGIQHDIVTNSAWSQLERYQEIVIGGGTLAALLSLWMTRKVPRHGKHK